MIPYDVRSIALGKSGLVALVSGEDFDAVNELTWRIDRHPHTNYAIANIYRVNSAGVRYRSTIRLHNFITSPAPGFQTHHRDHNGLHCWRGNLVVVRGAKNLAERRAYGISGYIGVTKKGKRWQAAITIEGKGRSISKYIGIYTTDIEAAYAYDNEARQRYGPYANCNFPLEPSDDATPIRVQTQETTDAIPF